MNRVFAFLVAFFARIAIWLRYRITVKGLDTIIKSGDRKGILFLPNHPALIDPLILNSLLWSRFHPRALADEKYIKNSALKYCWKALRILPIPDLGVAGMTGHDAVVAQLGRCVEALKAGDNLLLYPAGRIYHSKIEKLRGNGGVSRILQEYPETKVVLVRTTGLWGSDFSRCKGYHPDFGQVVKSHLKHLLLAFTFFLPRRHITIEFVPRPDDFPVASDKEVLNRYLEKFYNVAMRPNTYVPYTWFEAQGPRVLPEPDIGNVNEDTSRVPPDVREKVLAKLRELTGKTDIQDTNTLGTDLGLDSLIIAELQYWIATEFGHEVPSPEKLRTAASLMLAAIGEVTGVEPLYPVPPKWFFEDASPLEVTEGPTIPHTFLINAKRFPDRPVWADQLKGVFTNRKMVLAVMALRPSIAALPGERIGILMPATTIATLLYLATQFAGKVPVMINWTVGNRNMRHCVESTGLQHILTSEALIERLKGTGVDFSGLEDILLPLERVAKGVSIWRKLWSLLMSHLCWRSLWKAPVPPTAAILFTSGSESMPKTVPVIHEAIIADLKCSVLGMHFRKDACLLGMLPPFHSFGLLLNTLFTCVTNIRVVYHPNPTEGAMLARLTAAYKVNFFCGTPTFVANILRNATSEQLETLQFIVTGAEKCTRTTLDLMHEKAKNANLYEGYGITECGPIVSLNQPGHEKFGSIGRLMACSEGVVTNEECTKRLPPNTTGMLLVRGTNIFKGYINFDGPSPFVQFEGKEWYRTGDLVQMDEEGFIYFMGRLKRFVKIGGEMISLPALEEVLLEKYPNPALDHGPSLAVEALGTDDAPVITLFSTLPLERDEVNATLRAKGFSPIQSIRKVVVMSEIPCLGSGKTDYRTLKKHQLD